MPEIDRLRSGNDCFEVDFVEREATPNWAMKLGIRLHLAGLSLSNTVSELERFGVDRCRSTIHNWVQKAGLQPTEDKSPDHVAVDETVIQVDDQRYWLYAALAGGRHIHLVPTDEEEIEVGGEHVCLLIRSNEVESRGELDELLERLREHDVAVEQEEPRKRYGAYGRAWAAYVRDPDGRRVELKRH